MSEDAIFGLLFIGLFLTFPFLLILSILSCIACARTRAWKKEQRRLRRSTLDSATLPLVEPEVQDEEEEEDFLDTEDEEDFKAKKAEEIADRNLTTGQKFRKELGRAWTGKGQQNEVKRREREERKKVAKAVAREMQRLERRRAREARRNGGEGSSNREEGLPEYAAAVAGDRKSDIANM